MTPKLYDDAPRLPVEGSLAPDSLFAADRGDIELEIGPGRGWFMVERLESEPGVRIMGLEVRRKWAKIVDDRLHARGYRARARVFAEDAREALPRFPGASLQRVFINFPDPWWKKRHQKRLVIASATVAELSRVVVPGGELFVQTDVAERADAYERMIIEHGAFLPRGPTARVEDNPYGARSPRERRAMADGLPIYRLCFVRAS
jgi:tRNA (guanine-N7-)-methyltransferase